jgi:elongation factor G
MDVVHRGIVEVEVESSDETSFEIESELPQEIRDALISSFREVLEFGPLMGYPMVKIKAKFKVPYDPTFTPLGVRAASIKALQEAIQNAKPILLEPYALISVMTPQEYLGNIVELLSSIDGEIKNIYEEFGTQFVDALVPLKQTFDLANDLRSASQGRATYTIKEIEFLPSKG